MASSDTRNAVVNSQSVDVPSIDMHADTTNTATAVNGTSDSSAAAVPATSTPATFEVNDSSVLANGKLDAQQSHTDPSDAHVNGYGHQPDHLSTADTASVQGSVPDIDTRDGGSVGDAAISDTDSRGDAGEQVKDVNGNLKSGAAKKPTSFKAVSVTKNFLAKTATTTPSTRLADKLSTPTSSSPLAMARPRLVAKSGSGLRDSPRPRAGTEGPTDGNTVWNKNRPAPPPPPKQFTDEELKQQYGIHLASRIQADEGSKESKWADIDDDEDDWAPETIEWMDGTKSKTNPEPVPVTKSAEEVRPAEAKTMTPLKRPVATGPPKTILRPGAAQQVKLESMSGKDTPEQKAILSAKASAPVPVKSPWAALPPVDKSVPIFEPPPPVAAFPKPPFGSQDARFMEDSGPVVRHEIEADTFDRSWRDSTGPRELFNSQSGRYEPAPEGGRRASFRHEQSHRQPAVLQRSAEDEASPGYQRTQVDGNPWARRRSSVSQSAQSFERRVSIPPIVEATNPAAENRTGIVIGHDIGPQGRKSSDAAQTAQQAVTDRNEELARQKKIMQEKREAAIRRRREEEEREEAERRERIRLKLESLGMPLPEKKESEQEADISGRAPPTTKDGAAHSNLAKPSPGRNEQTPSHTSPATAPPAEHVTTDAGVQSRSQQQSHFTNQTGRQIANTANKVPQETVPGPVVSSSSPGEHKAQPTPFKSPALVADSFATWGNRTASNHASPASNVWGPPGMIRGIGNGAFDSSFSRVPPRLQNQNIMSQAYGPQNPRSPSMGGNNRQETSPMRHQQMLSDQNLAALGLVDAPTESFQTAPSAAPPPMASQAQPIALAPIGPPAYRQTQPFQNQVPPRGPAAWGREHTRPPYQQPQQAHVNHAGSQQQWKETFKQTRVSNEWNGAARPIVAAEKVLHQPAQNARPAGSPAPPVSQTQQPGGAQVAGGNQESTVRLPTSNTFVKAQPTSAHAQRIQPLPVQPTSAHQSRFFPVNIQYGSPPPEEANHPAQSGDRVPKVNLPRAKPTVRLPHPATAGDIAAAHPTAVIMPQRTPSYRGAQPLVQSSDWQARFNGLFGRVNTTTATPPSPPKTPPKMETMTSTAPASSSKIALFDPAAGSAATVSLPNRSNSAVASSTEMYVRPSAEELFDSELSFGSTPKVAVPRNASYSFGPERRGHGPHLLRMTPNARFDRRVVSLTREADVENRLITVATIKLSAGSSAKDVPLPVSTRVPLRPKLNEKRKTSTGKFVKSPKMGIEKENEAGSPAGTPVKLADRMEKTRPGSHKKTVRGGKWAGKDKESSAPPSSPPAPRPATTAAAQKSA